ncbi:minor capsid protein [Anaeromassilibacillus senegalensis]|uniref:minor capsid protein n=1 Tax=Anaeromassilibacillus senegalensis TaxID=1673717 RepID=UPI0006805998|nr:minor capsid protein [Anaeromassilibacillus senegalensis]
MNLVGRISVNMRPVNQILQAKGLTAGGDVQRFHTANVLRRIVKYMPYREGMLIKQTVASSPISKPYIVVPGPAARYLYYGKVMVDPVTKAAGFLDQDGQWKSRKGVPKVLSNRNIKYTKGKNPLAGPFWDRRLKAAEGKVLQTELQRYVNRKAGR